MKNRAIRSKLKSRSGGVLAGAASTVLLSSFSMLMLVSALLGIPGAFTGEQSSSSAATGVASTATLVSATTKVASGESSKGTSLATDDAASSSEGAEASATAEIPSQDASSEAAQTSDDQPTEAPMVAQKDATQPTTLEKKLKSVDGHTYTVRVSYGLEANVPEGTELQVVELNQIPADWDDEQKRANEYKDRPYATEALLSADDMAKNMEELSRALEIGEDGRILWNKTFDVSLVADGQAVTPNAEVQVEVETDAVSAAESDALEAALLKADGSRRLAVANATGTKEDEAEKPAAELTSRVAFATAELGRIGLAEVAQRKFGWAMHGDEISVYGARAVKTDPYEVPLDLEYVDGLRLIEVFGVAADPTHPFGTTLWVESKPAEGAQPSFDGVLGYRLVDGSAERVFGLEGTNGLAPFSAGDLMALVWDSGMRHTVLDAGDVTVAGEMPVGTTADAQDVTGECADARALVQSDEDEQARTLAAYNVSLSVDGTEWNPGADPVRVKLADDAIDTTSGKKLYDVVRVGEGGATPVTAKVEDGAALFDMGEAGSYAVVERVVVEREYEASDGKTYKITMSYDTASGFPKNAALVVNEVAPGDEGYDTYLEGAASELGTNVADVKYAKELDISIVDPETGQEFEPTKDVDVSIELLDRQPAEGTQLGVVHFGDDGKAEAVDAKAEGNTVEFSASGFSVYVVIEHEGDPEVVNARVEFHFLSQEYAEDEGSPGTYHAGLYSFVNKGGTNQTSQILKDGEALQIITNPPNITVDGSSKYFFGWYPVNGAQNGNDVTYTWPDDPGQIHFEKDLTIEAGTSAHNPLEADDDITWTIGGVTGTATLDDEGTAHVYLAPIYEDYYFVNFRFGAKESDIWGSIMNRRLIVLGEDEQATVRIGDERAPSTDATRQVFAGWETVTTKKQVIQKKDNENTPVWQAQKLDNGVPVWLVHNDETGEDEEIANTTQPEGSTAVMIEIASETQPDGYLPAMIEADVPDSTKTVFDSVDPVTGEENTATVNAADASPYSPAEESGYYIVINKSDLTGNSLDLYPFFAEARWIVFDTGRSKGNGATYVPSQYLLTSDHVQGENYVSPYYVTKLPVGDQPLRNGYEFKGWYADAKQSSTGDIENLNQEMDVTYTRADGTSITERLKAKQIADANGAVVAEDYQKRIDLDSDGTAETLLYEIQDGKLYVYNNLENLTLYALWQAVDNTEITVNVWRQKVTDDKNATDEEKTYDYVKDYSYMVSAQSGKDLAWLRANNKLRVGGTTTGTNVEALTETGFSLRGGSTATSTTMSTSAVSSDGTSVVNVYYDRDLRAINFYYYTYQASVTAPEGAVDAYQYTSTTSNSGTQYGLINEKYVQLSYTNGKWYAPEYEHVYTQDDTNGAYGLVNGNYVPLTAVTEPSEVFAQTSSLAAGKKYLIVNTKNPGNGVALKRNGTNPTTSFVIINSGSPVYVRSSDVNDNSVWTVNASGYSGYTFKNGTYYIRNNNNNLAISTSSSECKWYEDYNVLAVGSSYLVYSGSSFSLNNNWSSIYLFQETTMPVITGYTYDNNGTPTTYTGEHRYNKSYAATGNLTEYTLTRFTRSNISNSSRYRMVTWSGLYGQSLAQNGYSWDDVSDYYWREGITGDDGMGQTFLDSFIQDSNPYNLGTRKARGSFVLYHYRQQFDGLYTMEDRETAYLTLGTGSTTFNFSNKFDGFTVNSYSKGTNGFSSTGGSGTGSSVTISASDGALHVYHTRNKYTLSFKDNYPNVPGLTYDESGGESNGHEETVPYQASLTDYSSVYTPHAPDHYTFLGWYEDAAGTVEFNFNSSMPSGDKIIYGKWSPVKFQVQIDPNGGEIDHVNHNYTNPEQGYGDYWYNANNEIVYKKIENGTVTWQKYHPETKTFTNLTDSNDFGVTPLATFNRSDDSGYKVYGDQATYINATYGKTITEYEMDGRRQYVEITEAEATALGTGNWYYYLNTQYNADSDGSGLPSDLRNALYVTEAQLDEYYNFYVDWVKGNLEGKYITGTRILGKETWKDTYLAKNSNGEFQKYRPLHGTETYTFLGWYKLDANGNPESMPYNFADTVKDGFTLRAYWRLDGGYRILYTPEYTTADGKIINGEMEAWADPQDATTSYADGAKTNVYRQPTGITEDGDEVAGRDYIFRGWRLVSVRMNGSTPVYTPLEDGVYYDPSDEFTIAAGYADENSIIHFQAVYEKKESSYRRPDVSLLTLDANSGFVTTDGTDVTSGGTSMSWDDNGLIWLNNETEQMTFGYQTESRSHFQAGRTMHLYKYATELTQDSQGNPLDPAGKNYFKHNAGYFLLGFDEGADEGDYIASYPADSVISAQRLDNKTIYAVWEPMVYLNLTNSTKNTEYGVNGGDLTISLSSETGGLSVVNVTDGLYNRAPVADLNNITIPLGKTIRLAIPQGSGHEIKISGTNNLGTGVIMSWETTIPPNEEPGAPTGSVNNLADYEFNETLITDETGINVTFTAVKADYTLILNENYPDGTTTETYFSNRAEDANYVDNNYTIPSVSTRAIYEFLGWASTADATTPEFTANQVIVPRTAFSYSGTVTEKTLYAVWKAAEEPNTLYVHKVVPDPGNTEKEFSFKVKTASFTYRPQGTTSVDISGKEKEYTLKNNQYLKIVHDVDKGSDSVKAFFNVTVEKYEEGSDTPLATETFLTWNYSSKKSGSFSGYSLMVEESDYSSDYYSTDIEIASGVNHLTKSSRKVTWSNYGEGGTVIYTNTKQSAVLTVVKKVEGSSTGDDFDFDATWTAENGGISGDGNFTLSADGEKELAVPKGSNVIVTEKGSNLVNYTTTAVKDDESISLTETTETTEASDGATNYLRTSSPITVVESGTLIFTNTVKSIPVRIVKVGYDGTSTYTDVEAQFTLSKGASNVFTGRSTSPTATTPRGNIVFETGQVYSGETADPMLYVGDYTLEETKVYKPYIKLADEIALNVKGTAMGAELTVTGAGAEVRQDGDVWVVTVTNRRTADITVRAGLSDPLVNQRTFTYSGSYTLDEEAYTIDSFELTAYPTEDGSVSASHMPKTITVPLGAENLTFTQTPIADTYKTTAQRNSEDVAEANEYVYSNVIADGNNGDIITFTNTRKTNNLTISKTVKGSDTSGSFSITARLAQGEVPVRSYEVGTDNGGNTLATNSDGQVTFSLGHNGTQFIKVPVGANVTVQENLTDEQKAAFEPFMVVPGSQENLVSGDEATYSLAAQTTDTTLRIINNPCICKVTDGSGDTLLYRLDNNGTDDTSDDVYLPAVYGMIKYAVVDVNSEALYEKNESESGVTFALFSGTAYQVQMLCDYTVPNTDVVPVRAGHTLTFTTASPSASDGYPFRGGVDEGTRATLTCENSYPMSLITVTGAEGNTTNFIMSNLVIHGDQNAQLDSNVHGGALNAVGSVVTINNCKVTNFSAADGGAVYANGGSLTVTDSVFQGCKANNGGGIYMDSGTLDVSNSTIESCEATANGGGLFVGSSAMATIQSGIITKNEAVNGGGIYVDGNSALSDDARGALNVSGGSITENTATGNGSAVYLNDYARANVSGGSISANVVTETAGAVGIAGKNARINFSNAPFIYNNTYGDANNLQNNVMLSVASDQVINVTAPLTDGAKIGVMPTYDQNRKAGDPFGMTVAAGANSTLEAFVNDYQLNTNELTMKGWPKTEDAEDQVIWRRVLQVEVYKYTSGGYDTAEQVGDTMTYVFPKDLAADTPVAVDEILSTLGITAPDGCAYDTAIYGDLRNTAAIYQDSRMTVHVRKDDGSLTTTLVKVKQGEDWVPVYMNGSKLKVYYYKTNNLIPVLVEKEWNAPQNQIEANDDTAIGFGIKKGESAVTLYTDSISISGSPRETIAKSDEAILGNSDSTTSWAKLLYLQSSEDTGGYSITETTTPAVADDAGAWASASSVKDLDAGDPLNAGVWTKVEDENLAQGYLKLPCIQTRDDYKNVESFILYIESVDGYCYRTDVKLDSPVDFMSGTTYYIPVLLPKDVPYCSLILPQSDGHNVVPNVVKPYQSGETFYGIKTINTSDGTHQPRYTELGLYDNGQPNSTGGPIIFENVAFVTAADASAGTVLTSSVSTAPTLRVFVRKRFTMTNAFRSYPTVEVYQYTKGAFDSAERVYSGIYPLPTGNTYKTVEDITSDLIGQNKYTVPDGYNYDTAMIGEMRNVTSINLANKYKVDSYDTELNIPDGEALKIYYVKSDNLQPVVIRKEWDAPDSQKAANENSDTLSLPFTVNDGNAVYPSNVKNDSAKITAIAKADTATVSGLGQTATPWAKLAFVPMASSYTLAEDSSGLTVSGDINGGWNVSYPAYASSNSYNDWVTVASQTDGSLTNERIAEQTDARVAYLRVKNNESAGSSFDKLRVMYKDIDGVTYESYVTFASSAFESQRTYYVRILIPKNVDLQSLELLYNGDDYYNQEPLYNSLSSSNKSYGFIIGTRAPKFKQTGFYRNNESGRAFVDIAFLNVLPDGASDIDFTSATLKVYAPTRLTMKNNFTRSFTVSKNWVDVPATEQANLEAEITLYKVTGTGTITVPPYVSEADAAGEKAALEAEGYSVTEAGTCTLREGVWSYTFTGLPYAAEYYAVETAVKNTMGTPDTADDKTVTEYIAVYDYDQARGTLTVENGDYIARVSNDDGASWTYHRHMINSGDDVTGSDLGAFDRANSLDGDVIIETLKETAVYDDGNRYALKSGVTISDPTSITLRTTQDTRWNPSGEGHFRSTLIRGTDNTGSMFTVPANKSFTTEYIILDGGAEFNATTRTYERGAIKGDGGIVNVADSATLTVNGGTVMQKTAVIARAKVDASDGNPAIPEALGSGGAIQVNQGGNFSITGIADNSVVFDRCYAANGGGAINIGKTNKKDDVFEKSIALNYATFTYCEAKGSGDGTSAAGAVRCMANTLTLDHCEFDHCYAQAQGGAVYQRGTTKFQADDCKFEYCIAGKGATKKAAGALEAQANDVDITRCSFEHCYSTSNAGALNIWNESAAIDLDSCTFKDCHALLNQVITDPSSQKNGHGGAFRTTGNTTNIKDCTFENCYSSIGGAVCCNGNKNKTKIWYTDPSKAVTFKNCAATDKGGAVYQVGGTLEIQSGKMQNCAATNGGGVYQYAGNCSVTGGEITNCEATKVVSTGTEFNVTVSTTAGDSNKEYDGGGIYLGGGKLAMSGGSVSACSATVNGGGVYLSSGTLSLTGGGISTSHADQYGGGAYIGGGQFTFSDGLIDQCYAKAGGGVYIAATESGKPVTITKNGNAITNCTAGTATTLNGVTTFTYGSDNDGGGIYQNGGELEIKNASISDCHAYEGAGIYLNGTGKICIGQEGGIKGGTISSNTASNNGGGIAMGGGELTMYAGSINSNTANQKGGGVSMTAGTLTMHEGSIDGNIATNGNGGGVEIEGSATLDIKGGSVSENSATNGFGGAIYQGGGSFTLEGGMIGQSGKGNTAKRGAGLYILNGTGSNHLTTVNIFGGKIMYNVATEAGGGIAVGNREDGSSISGPVYAELKFQGDIEVWANKQGSNPNGAEHTDWEWCNVLFDWDWGIADDVKNNQVIFTTPDGLDVTSHIGVYVTGSTDTANHPDSLFARHGDWDKPFGTFVNPLNVHRFINDRSIYYSHYYGVIHAEDDFDIVKNIYWVRFVCKITDENNNLLFADDAGTSPCLYRYLGTGQDGMEGAFDALGKYTKFYREVDGTNPQQYEEATPKYVKMLVDNYELHVEGGAPLPSSGFSVTLTTAATNENDTHNHLNGTYDSATGTGICVIKRGVAVGSMITTAAGSDLTLKNIVIDGGATYNETTKELTDTNSISANGALLSADGNLTLDTGATLHNSVTTGNGGAINASGTFTVKSGAVVEHCKAANGGAVSQTAGTATLEGGSIIGCEATNGGGYYQTAGTATLEGCTIIGCDATKGGGVYQTGGTFTIATGGTLTECTASRGGGAWVQPGGTFRLDGGALTKCSVMTTVGDADANGTQTVTDGTGGGVYVNGGTLTISDGGLTDCSARLGGGAYVQGGTLSMAGGTVSGNTVNYVTYQKEGADAKSGGQGGGVYINNNGTLSMTGGTISDNVAKQSGGGVYQNGGVIDLSGGVIERCYALSTNVGGGGICAGGSASDDSKLNGVTIRDCYAPKGGGLYYMAGDHKLTISDGAIENCVATTVTVDDAGNAIPDAMNSAGISNGGGMFVSSGEVILSGGNVQYNAAKYGSGAYLYKGTLTISDNGSINNNDGSVKKADGSIDTSNASGRQATNGGGVYVGTGNGTTSGTLNVSGGKIEKNEATSGGGVYVSNGTVTVSGGEIGGNKALDGAGIYHNAGSTTISGGTIGSASNANTASRNGGGLYQKSNGVTLSGTGRITSNEAVNGAGVYVANGSPDAYVIMNMIGGNIIANEASGSGGGIEVGGEYVQLNFSGDAKVGSATAAENNTADGVRCNVCLDQDCNTIINTAGLNHEAYIGVYVPGDDTTADPGDASATLFDKHGDEKMPFGTDTTAATQIARNMDRFINDRNTKLVGGKLYTDDKKIYWMSYVCKITDGAGNLLYKDAECKEPALYVHLGNNDRNYNADYAFNVLNKAGGVLYSSKDTLYTGTDYCVKMIVENYDWLKGISVLGNTGKKVILTTAGENDVLYPYEGASGTYATIKRSGTEKNNLITNRGMLTLTGIVLDGGAKDDFSGLQANVAGAIAINKDGGKLIIAENATLQNSYTTHASGGGAVANGSSVSGGANANNQIIIQSGSINHCKASNSGGAITVGSGTMVMTGGEITSCYAQNGSAVYALAGTSVTFASGSITGNTATADKGGAVNVADATAKLYFGAVWDDSNTRVGGSPSIRNNVKGTETRNVVLSINDNSIIQTTEYGLNDDAYIGVYVTGNNGTNETEPYKNHGGYRDDFGTYANTDRGKSNLDCFINDRNNMYGEICTDSAHMAENPTPIRWTCYVCKITGENGQLLYYKESDTNKGKAVFKSLSDAYANLTNLYTDADCSVSYTKLNSYTEDTEGNKVSYTKIEMILDTYDLPSQITANETSYVTLTTASTSAPDGYRFVGGDGEAAVIYRGSNCNESMFYISNDSMNLTLENITVDGQKNGTDHQVTGSGALFYVANGNLIMNADTTLQNGIASNMGGGVYLGNADTSFVMNGGLIQNCTAYRDDYYAGGGVCIDNGSLTMKGGKIKNCHASGSGSENNSYNGGAGGGIAIGDSGTLTMSGGTITGCTSVKSGAAVEIHGYLYMSGGTITGNSSIYGGAINFLQNHGTDGHEGRIFLSGDPYIAENKMKDGSTWNAGDERNIDISRFDAVNNDQWANVIEKIYVDGELSEDAVIGVYAPNATDTSDHGSHVAETEDFGLYKSDLTHTERFVVFKNDRNSELAGWYKVEGSAYKLVWKNLGELVSFNKTDGSGDLLPGAEFSLYTELAMTGEAVSLKVTKSTSAEPYDETDTKATATDAKDTTTKCNVNFKVGTGIYYMKEVNTPTTTKDGKTTTWKNTNKYVVIVGSTYLEMPSDMTGTAWADDGVLKNIKADDITAQTGTGEDAKKYAIFLIDPTTNEAVTDPDIATYGIMNQSTAEHKVILRKISDSYESLPDAYFRIFTADMTEIINDEYDKTNKGYKSLSSGVYFIDTLSEGKYYLLETVKPTGAADGNTGKAFVLTVDANGVTQKELGKKSSDNKYDATILQANETSPLTFTGENSDAMVTAFKNWMKEQVTATP